MLFEGRHRSRLKGNTGIDRKEIEAIGTGFIWPRTGFVVGQFEHGNEHFGSVKGWADRDVVTGS
jgi:hypothetical protein